MPLPTLAPEQYDERYVVYYTTDIWAAGMTAAVVFTETYDTPWVMGADSSETMAEIVLDLVAQRVRQLRRQRPAVQRMLEDLYDMLAHCMMVSKHAERWTAVELLTQHPFFTRRPGKMPAEVAQCPLSPKEEAVAAAAAAAKQKEVQQ